MKVTFDQARQAWRDDCATTSCNAVAFPCFMKEQQDPGLKYYLTTMFCGHCAAYCLAARYWKTSRTVSPDSDFCVTCMCAPAVLTKLESNSRIAPAAMEMVRTNNTIKV